jgi:hypothetical protein
MHKTGWKAGYCVAVRSFWQFLGFSVAEWRQVTLAVVVAAGVLGVAGCATAPPGGASETGLTEAARVATVTKRAEERWALLIKGDVKAAYAYLSPASRAVMSLERYEAKTRTGNFREIKLDRVSCEAETCRVRLFLTFDHRVMQGVVTPIEEIWVFEGGQAWFVYLE